MISPLLANLSMHYAFDEWMRRRLPAVPFERYADDVVIHCANLAQALQVLEAVRGRLRECKLELHPEKSNRAVGRSPFLQARGYALRLIIRGLNRLSARAASRTFRCDLDPRLGRDRRGVASRRPLYTVDPGERPVGDLGHFETVDDPCARRVA